MVRRLASITAIIAWASLALQLGILLRAQPAWASLWLFVGYFTILTNMLVAVMATGLALGQASAPLTEVKARMAVTAAIAMVGIAYWLLLAAQWQPQGWQLVADIGLHTAVPLLALATWVAARDGTLVWRDCWLAAVWPATYAVYALARGRVDGWYAYWFFDPAKMGWGGIAMSALGLSLLVVGIGASLVAADRTHRG